MGSQGSRWALGRRTAIVLVAGALVLSFFAASVALAWRPKAVLTVDDPTPAVGQTVHFNASASQGYDDGDGKIVAYRFAFGDGTGTDWQSSPYAAHAYTAPGNVTASVTVKTCSGQTDTASVDLTVQPLPPPFAYVRPVFATIAPSTPTEGDFVNGTAVLLNNGTAAATSAVLAVSDVRPNGTSVALGTVEAPAPLDPGSVAIVPFGPFPAVGAGNHTLRLVVMNVTPPSPDGDHALNLTMIVLAPAPPPLEHPDLAPIVATFAPAQPVDGRSVNLTVFILNRGTADADAASLLVFDERPNGTTGFLGLASLPEPLAPGDVEPIPFGPFLAQGVGTHILEVLLANVTPSEAVTSNNALNVTMDVSAAPAPPAPDLEPVFAAPDPSQAVAGSLVNLTVVVLNRGTASVSSADLTVVDERPNGTTGTVGSLSIPGPIDPSASRNVVLPPFVASGVGNHTLRIVVDHVVPAPSPSGPATLEVPLNVTALFRPPSPTAYARVTPLFASLAPPSPAAGDFVNLTVFLLNHGNASATSARVLAVDVRPDGTTQTLGPATLSGPLAPFDVETLALGPLRAAGVGSHTLRIVVTGVAPSAPGAGDAYLNLTFVVGPAPSTGASGGVGFDYGALIIAVLIAAAIVAVAIVAALASRPSPPEPLEPPTHVPPDTSPPSVWPP